MSVSAQHGRMRWWYESIIDWMIANPDRPMYECAAALHKSPSTISLIVNSDVFKHYYAERRRAWVDRHDTSIVKKTTQIAEESLDLTLEVLKQRRTSVPLSQLVNISESALGRLGYGVKGQGNGVTVNVGPGAGAQVIAIPRSTLAEARAGLRAIEQSKVIDITPSAVSSDSAPSAVRSDLAPAAAAVSSDAPKAAMGVELEGVEAPSDSTAAPAEVPKDDDHAPPS